jgi:hypothetical protein
MNMSAAAKAILLVLCLLLPSYALAQAEGEVESIGFGGHYRPNCWTSMKLRLRPTIGKPATYKIAIMQEDMDRDRVLYSRPFTLNGNPEGGRIEERVWVYFLPQPRDLQQARTAQELSNLIKVILCKEDGTQLVQIPIPPGTATLTNLDDPGVFGSNRSARFVLTVGTSQSGPFRDIYANARGITEEVIFRGVTPSDLPQNVLGYQAVDAIIWMDADPIEPESDTIAAIQEYVGNGGTLVVTQNPDWQRMKESELAALLPVELTGVEDEEGLLSLRRLAEVPRPGKELARSDIFSLPNGETIDPWSDTAKRIVPIAKASVRPGAIVNAYQFNDRTAPYLARWMHGHGTVIWAAQDFGNTELLSSTDLRKLGWQHIWDKVFDWPNRTVTLDMATFSRARRLNDGWSQEFNTVFKPAINNTDLSSSLLGAMELPRRGAALVALAVIFFIGYWLVAGPGSYFFLLAKKQARYSWVAFAACALAATGLTIVVVRLVLRGPPQLQHVTFVRVAPGQDAVAHSHFGLYIPRDGMQQIELKETAAKRAASVTPYPVHPLHLVDSSEYPAYMEYEVPVPDRTTDAEPSIQVPYRSTLKKFQARWIGKLPGAIEGKARLSDGTLSGVLTNNTGGDLHNVYFVYYPGSRGDRDMDDDIMIWLPDGDDGRPAWPAGASVDLGGMPLRLIFGQDMGPRPRDRVGDRGFLNGAFAESLWKSEYLGIHEGIRYGNLDRAALLMTIYDRLQPVRGKKEESVFSGDRYELHRRGGRHLDASSAVSAGHLLVLARSRNAAPLPFPLHVEGDLVQGEGVTYYQFIIPMERSGGASTRPSGYTEDEAEGIPATEDEQQKEDDPVVEQAARWPTDARRRRG